MSNPTAAYRSPFRLSPASPLQSALLSLPLELRYIVYAEIFQPRTYHYEKGPGLGYVHHEECRHVATGMCQPCSSGCLSHHTCGCSLVGAVSLLRTCQQIYIEAQPHFLLSACLELHMIHHFFDEINPYIHKGDQLRWFHREFLCSSLSGLVPGDYLRRLGLRFFRVTGNTVFDNLKAINDCRLQLDCLQLQFTHGSLPSYCDTGFISSPFFEVMSLLRDIKKVQLTWGDMDRTLVRASDEPEIYTKLFTHSRGRLSDFPELEAYLKSVQERYCALLNRAFSELTSRPRATKALKRFTTLQKEAKAIFLIRMQELMEESRLYLAPDT